MQFENIKIISVFADSIVKNLVPFEVVTIDSLNDDCLMNIFQQLSALDRLNIELVCKRWNSMSKLSWYHFTEILIEPRRSAEKIEKKKLNQYKQILERCHSFLKALTIVLDSDYAETENLLKMIPRYCKTVKILSLRGGNYAALNNYLEAILIKISHLECIDVGNLIIDGNCFAKVDAEKIKAFWINDCEILNTDCFFVFLQNTNNLTNVKIIDNYEGYMNNAVKAIAQGKNSSISELCLLHDGESSVQELGLLLEKQKKIQKLDIEHVMVESEPTIKEPTSLKELSIRYYERELGDIFPFYSILMANLVSFEADLFSIDNKFFHKLTTRISKNVEKIIIHFSGLSTLNSQNKKTYFCYLNKLKLLSIDYECEDDEPIIQLIDQILEDVCKCPNLEKLKLPESNKYANQLINSIKNKCELEFMDSSYI